MQQGVPAFLKKQFDDMMADAKEAVGINNLDPQTELKLDTLATSVLVSGSS